MRIMKTNFRTLVAIVALGLIGFTNINATEDNKKASNDEVIAGSNEMTTNHSFLTDEAFIKSAEALTAMDADGQIEKYATKQIQLVGNAAANSDFLDSAKSFTASGANREIEKYAQKQISLVQAGTEK